MENTQKRQSENKNIQKQSPEDGTYFIEGDLFNERIFQLQY